MSKSNYLENEVLDHVLGKGARNFTSPASLFLALFEDGSGPGEAGGGTEISTGGYARQAINFDAASGGSADNSAQVEFFGPGGATANVGDIGHWAIFDAASTGNLIYYGDFDVVKSITTSDIYRVPAGALTISEA